MGGPIANMTAAYPPAMKKLKVHTGDFTFDDRRDLDFLKLLGDEIRDDHVLVITEGLQVQKALKSSFEVADSDMSEVSDEKKAVVVELQRSGDLIDEGLQQVQTKALKSEVDDSDMIATEVSDEKKAVVVALRTGSIVDSDGEDEDSPEIVSNSEDMDEDDDDYDSDSKFVIGFFDFAEVEERIAAADDTPPLLDVSESVKKSSALFSDSAPAVKKEKEIWSSDSAPSAAATGTSEVNYAAADGPNSFLNAVFDDFTPKDKIWVFCELCGVVQDNQRTLIKVPECGHCFCNYCFEWHSASQIVPDEAFSMIKCPVASCFNEIHPDQCVALLLQHTLDNENNAKIKSSSISDNWEFLDTDELT